MFIQLEIKIRGIVHEYFLAPTVKSLQFSNLPTLRDLCSHPTPCTHRVSSEGRLTKLLGDSPFNWFHSRWLQVDISSSYLQGHLVWHAITIAAVLLAKLATLQHSMCVLVV